jgi:hypothetical protein
MQRNQHSIEFKEQALSKVRARGSRTLHSIASEIRVPLGALKGSGPVRAGLAHVELLHFTDTIPSGRRSPRMPKSKAPYLAEFRQHMVELAHAGRGSCQASCCIKLSHQAIESSHLFGGFSLLGLRFVWVERGRADEVPTACLS